MGDWNGGAARSLWWPRYDNVPDLKTNWKNFGGWTKAVMKQYSGDKTVCTMDVDLNFY